MQIKVLGLNQTVVKTRDGSFFFSYETLVAAYFRGAFYKTSKFYSKTTSRHISNFLSGVSAQTVPQDVLEEMAES